MNVASLLLGFTQWAESTVGDYGYLGIFLVSLIGNLTIFFPVPAFAFVFAMGAVLNPWLVGLAGGLGGGLGEISGYFLGRGGRKAVIRRYSTQLKKTRKWALKHGMFPIIILFATTPLPSDIIGILSGLIRYNLKKFLLANVIGKTIINIVIAYAGFYSFDAIKLLFGT